jgi:hypothetical protein
MAENESLDVCGSLRMRRVSDAFRAGASCEDVSVRLEKAFVGWLRKALKRINGMGVGLRDLLMSRGCPRTLRQLLRKAEGHDCIRLFADAAAVSGPTEKDCVAGWINAGLDKLTDQICHSVAGSEHYPTMGAVQAFVGEVREKLRPVVERLVTKFAEDPDWLPRQAPTKGQVPADATDDLMSFSLLGAKNQ